MKYSKIFIIFCHFFIIPNNYAELNQYYCTAADSRFYSRLKNLIGSIHETNFENLSEIAVFDLGLENNQINELTKMQKVNVYNVEMTNPYLLTSFLTAKNGRRVKGYFAWKPVIIKQALEKFPYVLYMDAGTCVLKPINNIFEYINENGYFLISNPATPICNVINRITKPVLEEIVSKLPLDKQKQLLDEKTILLYACIQGLTRNMMRNYVMPMYNHSKNLKLFEDDGSARMGYGEARHDQTLFHIYAFNLNLNIHPVGWFELKTNKTTHKVYNDLTGDKNISIFYSSIYEKANYIKYKN